MRVLVALVVVCLVCVTASVLAEEPSDPDGQPVVPAERPALGMFGGVTMTAHSLGEDVQSDGAIVFETPLLRRTRFRADASRSELVLDTFDPRRRKTIRESAVLDSVRVSVLRVRHLTEHMTRYIGAGYGAYRVSYLDAPKRDVHRRGLHAVAGVETTEGRRWWAWCGEMRVHTVLLKVDMTFGMKLRF